MHRSQEYGTPRHSFKLCYNHRQYFFPTVHFNAMLNWIKKRLPGKKQPPRDNAGSGKRSHGVTKPSATSTHPVTVADATTLGIDSRRISDNALRVMQKLNDAGYEAYIVGGGVRDLLLGMRPKDFDIATSATPEQVRHVFRNSRIIGRRFRIVHVLFGRETIEVTTFRGHHSNAENARDGESNDAGLLVRDNVYGSLEEDALRRDFTVNALYYCVDGKVRDYCNGLKDIQQRQIRMIGEPDLRYREDPVRMLRAVRLAAKLSFTLEKHTAAPITRLAPLLNDISNARLFDEMLKLLMAGAALKTFELLLEYHLFQVLFPGPARLYAPGNYSDQLFRRAMLNTDERIRKDLRVTPAFLYAAFLWPAVQQQKHHAEQDGTPPYQALQRAAQKVISEQVKRIGIPKRFSVPMQEIWEMQFQLDRRQGERAERLLENPRFRAAYDFLLLREQAGEDLNQLGQWWTDYQAADTEERLLMVKQLQNPASKNGQRRRRGGRKPSGAGKSEPAYTASHPHSD